LIVERLYNTTSKYIKVALEPTPSPVFLGGGHPIFFHGVLTCGGGGPSTFSRKNNQLSTHI